MFIGDCGGELDVDDIMHMHRRISHNFTYVSISRQQQKKKGKKKQAKIWSSNVISLYGSSRECVCKVYSCNASLRNLSRGETNSNSIV